LLSRASGYLEPAPPATGATPRAPVVSETGAGPFLVGVTVLIRPFASKVNSSMQTERRKELPFESSLV
jgi:hypothetical protein